MENTKEFAIETAKLAGKALMEKFGNLKSVEYKGVYDLLTEADLAADNIITERIKEKFPNHNIVSEESKHEKTDSEYEWYIDPLDGTLNFAAGIPIFATMIGLAKNGEMILGVVYNPVTDEMFTAEKGKGAFLNKERIQVSKESNIRNVLVSAPTNRTEDMDKVKRYTKVMERLIPKVRGIRIYNTASIEITSIARGQFGAKIGFDFGSWDIAAPRIILEEAGGKVTDLEGKEAGLHNKKGYLLSNSILHEEIIDLIK